mmetsp:Transcript_11033/g.41126  ORF Transcript_11033/g.41126 Transcript_11033/m.41126 type:complete len:280 (+) Transcript_11033:339-1178(+)
MPTETKFRFNVPHWKEFTTDQLKILNEERQKRGTIEKFENKEYGSICPACEKPNTLKVTYCTGCAFPLTKEDIQQLPDNVFLDILQGRRTDTEILFRTGETAGWSDKFGVSRNHLDVVSEEPILDITTLDESHVKLLGKMYMNGLKELEQRDEVQRMLKRVRSHVSKTTEGPQKQITLHDLVTTGYNYPVSVKHLHLHMVLPPFKHRKVFEYPRWHSHTKVVKDLETDNKVTLYQDAPNEEEGAAEYTRAMQNHDLICEALGICADDVTLDVDPTLKEE